MNRRQRYTLSALENMLVFVTNNPLPPPLRNIQPAFEEQIDALRAAIVEAQSYATDQGSGLSQKIIRKKRNLIHRLRSQHLQPMRNIARVIESSDPGMPKLLNIPRNFSSEQSVIASARAARRDIVPYSARFISGGLTPDFLTKLDSILQEIDQTKDLHYRARTQKVSARAGLRSALSAGIKARECLTVIIRLCCADDEEHGPSTLRGWFSASRIRKSNTATSDMLEKKSSQLRDASDLNEAEDKDDEAEEDEHVPYAKAA